MDELIYRMPGLTKVVGLGKTKLYEMMAAGQFPAPVELGPNSVGWRADEIKAWVENLPHREFCLE